MTPEQLRALRKQTIEATDSLLQILPQLKALVDRRTVESPADLRILFAAAEVAMNIVSYGTFAGAGTGGILDAVSRHVADRVRRGGG